MTHDHDRTALGAEARRLREDADRTANWKRWGPYLAERQWGTVREDYSADGDCWNAFPHDHARSRAYRWGEDGLLGITDRECRMCFALALWNERDPILKERLFGLTNPEGNHGEDVKEQYFYLDSTPTHAFMKALYKYPQAAFPYEQLVQENRRRGNLDPEYELVDTGAFDDDRYFDVFVEYAKDAPDHLVIVVTLVNRARERARLHVLPTVWFRNTWAWGGDGEDMPPRPRLRRLDADTIATEHETLGRFRLVADRAGNGPADLLFTENDTNVARLFGAPNPAPHVKDAFHEYVVHGNVEAVSPEPEGTKAALHYVLEIPGGGERVLRFRLAAARRPGDPADRPIDDIVRDRRAEADAFHDARVPATLGADERNVVRQAYAGLMWSKQFYHYDVRTWQTGDPAQPAPDASRLGRRNGEWGHLYNRDVISMPDKWE
ncbi:MAG: glucosidase, partial [Phycisphaerales bacterium]|nr:glucosidase [Phycisphaerales bacterium]